MAHIKLILSLNLDDKKHHAKIYDLIGKSSFSEKFQSAGE